MPTTRPRYTLTDAGDLADMLDVAARRWPEEPSRKDLLMRLATTGRDAVAQELVDEDQVNRRERQREALAGLSRHVDQDLLLGDFAWR